jgi:uncharacterized protein DUF4192
MDFAEPSAPAALATDAHELRLDGPQSLLQAVPYLLGFHPRDSLVLVGVGAGAVRVTARLDLADATRPGPLEHAFDVLVRGGSDAVIAVGYDDLDGQASDCLPSGSLVAAVEAAAVSTGCLLVDTYLVRGGRWWSRRRNGAGWGTGVGESVADPPSAFAAAATVAGLTALPSRRELVSVLDPCEPEVRERLRPMIEHAQVGPAGPAAATAGPLRPGNTERALTRAVFTAARRADDGSLPTGDADVARLGAALSITGVRDSVWLAIDDGLLDGRALWAQLARFLPSPYDAAALFLFGWTSWRRGDGVSAQAAVERALTSVPTYTAAELLHAALVHGLDPRRVPRLRRRKRANRASQPREAGRTRGH